MSQVDSHCCKASRSFFSKAFDKVPHQRLINKCNYYGIQGKNLQWIASFHLDEHSKPYWMEI
jgi:hypothetical protein